MGLFRSKEIIIQLIGYLLVSLVLCVGAFFCGLKTGFYVLGVCILFLLLHFIHQSLVYKKIGRLADELDRLLYGDESVSFTNFQEGELAILNNALGKLVNRLREQADSLVKDKVYLADSIADISHQIRTPLTSVNLIVDFLKAPDLSFEKRRELLFEMERLLSRIDWLVGTLLKISKLDAGTIELRKEAVNMKELIKKAEEAIAIPMELRNQRFQLECDGTEQFHGDFPWTLEAVSNIMKNCMEHTPNGGSIKVSLFENPIVSKIVIEDTGSGLSMEDCKHLFDRFYKGKNSSADSVGIGLALAKTIIHNQNGTLKAENRKHGGARFIIQFHKGIL